MFLRVSLLTLSFLFLVLVIDVQVSFSLPTPPIVSNNYYDPELTLISLQELFQFNSTVWQVEDESNGDLYQKLAGLGHLYGHLTNESQLTNALTNSSTFLLELNGICRMMDQQHGLIVPSFELILSPNTTFTGLVNITQETRTVECQSWTWNNTVVFYVDNSSPSTPIRVFFNSSSGLTFFMDFSSSFESNPPFLSLSSPIFDAPEICFQPHVCPQGPVIPLEVYNFHSVDDFYLNNTNTADILGDTTFFCKALLFSEFTYFQWISQWQVEVNSTWGQYNLCNFGQCLGGSHDLIGREAPDGLQLEFAGQCTPNRTVGTWYSFPQGTECLQNQSVGDSGCNWKVLQRSKTINATCLSSSELFLETCRKEFFSGNLTQSAQIYAQAFLSDDPTEGGCPPIAIDAQNPNGRSLSLPSKPKKSGAFFQQGLLQMLSAEVYRVFNENKY